MSQPGMRVTVDAAMRARDVSRATTDDTAKSATEGDGRSARKPPKGERRRQGKRSAK